MPRARFCYVILCHTDAEVVLRLARRIRELSPDASVLIRHDQAGFIDEESAAGAGAHLLKSDVVVRWGGWSMTAAVLEAFEHALQALAPDFIVLVSGQDYPVRDLAAWESSVVGSGADALVGPMLEPLYRPRYSFRWTQPLLAPRWLPTAADALLGRTSARAPALLRRLVRADRNPRDGRWSFGVRRWSLLVGRRPSVPITKGSQWITLSDRAVRRFTDRHRSDHRLRRFFQTTQLADEMYLPSVLRADAGLVVLEQPTSYARFVGSSDSPVWVTLDEVRAAVSSGAAFVRKVPAGADDVRAAADELTSAARRRR